MGINLGKPPLGLVPEFYYERARIQEICRAISDYVGEIRQEPRLEVWVDELKKRISIYNRLNSKGGIKC